MTAADDLTAQLTAHIDRIDDLLATQGPDAILALPVDRSFVAEFVVFVSDLTADHPSLMAHAAVDPGGRIDGVTLEAQLGDESASIDLEPEMGAWKAVQILFDDMWTSWDEVPEPVAGQAVGLCVSDLQPGDLVVRLDLRVAGLEDAGMDTNGDRLVAVHFEGNPGREVWRSDRALTIIRDGDGKRRAIKVTRQQVAAAKIVRALDQAEGCQSAEWVERLVRAGSQSDPEAQPTDVELAVPALCAALPWMVSLSPAQRANFAGEAAETLRDLLVAWRIEAGA